MFGPPSCRRDSSSRISELLPHGSLMTDTHPSSTADSTMLASSPTDLISEGRLTVRDYCNRVCQSAPAGYQKADYISCWPNDLQGLYSLREETRVRAIGSCPYLHL
ncbi:hypothetical protein EVAR_21698_1 [Eumeta japonica]|uniref:Uncharacterized protein n=1 Tax=Eumeta variegata TaxID=151549 RepID=A0A4C1W699_EUMVA|nr:hypothetical protein EVAR_21698_1 [Eumeta japonica]